MFEVRITPKAKGGLKKLPSDAFYTVSQDILSLEKNHSPDGHRIKKIGLVKGFYRLRTGSYRSVFYIIAGLSFCSCAVRTIEQIVAKAEPSIVSVMGKGYGTGFFINKYQILTNAHVVKGAQFVWIKDKSGEYLKASIIKLSDRPDLALLKLANGEGEPLDIDYTYSARSGEEIIVIGNPLGLERSVSTGRVSGLRKEYNVNYLQIGAPISPGNSGSPVLNRKGKVIGVAASVMSHTILYSN